MRSLSNSPRTHTLGLDLICTKVRGLETRPLLDLKHTKVRRLKVRPATLKARFSLVLLPHPENSTMLYAGQASEWSNGWRKRTLSRRGPPHDSLLNTTRISGEEHCFLVGAQVTRAPLLYTSGP